MKAHDGAAAARLGAILREAHHRIEAAESGRISQAEMAARLGVSQRAYVDYLHGRGPAGARVALDILAMLGEDEAVALLRRWREGIGKNGKDRNG
ncbi:helix-turn-helix domain-containing protein [Burkholderia multivorans]|uniref:helix-turn-helix domain-containing protein n=1 Tax=Burkholderia multivorans TaxID=87883 RepID=UPI0019D6B3D5|nr:helix-turn-helix domain-containing protein [Burkholderia multivorans]